MESIATQLRMLGRLIHQKIDNVTFTVAKMKRSDQIKPLAFLFSNVKLGKSMVYFNPLTLFTRLIAMVQREDNMEKFFDYEMSVYPLSIFKNGMMRKPDKPAIRKYLVGNNSVPESSQMGCYVLDGGALLHRVRWMKDETYQETLQRYAQHVERYGKCTIVFDGYGRPWIKDVLK